MKAIVLYFNKREELNKIDDLCFSLKIGVGWYKKEPVYFSDLKVHIENAIHYMDKFGKTSMVELRDVDQYLFMDQAYCIIRELNLLSNKESEVTLDCV